MRPCAQPWQLPGSLPSAVHATEGEAQVEPRTRASQLREHCHMEVYSNHGKLRLVALSHTHTGTHAHTFRRADTCHTPWPYHTPGVPSNCPFPIHTWNSFPASIQLKSDLGSGAGVQDTELECFLSHGCPGTGKIV